MIDTGTTFYPENAADHPVETRVENPVDLGARVIYPVIYRVILCFFVTRSEPRSFCCFSKARILTWVLIRSSSVTRF